MHKRNYFIVLEKDNPRFHFVKVSTSGHVTRALLHKELDIFLKKHDIIKHHIEQISEVLYYKLDRNQMDKQISIQIVVE